MARKPHGLLLLFEGLPATVIQSQVFARVRWLEDRDIASFEILSFAHSKVLYHESAVRLSGMPSADTRNIVLAKSIKPALPGSRFLNRRILAQFALRAPRKFDFVQARGDYAASVAGPWAFGIGLPMIWDCRGDGEAEFRERKALRGAWGPHISWRARQAKHDGRIAARTSAAASFVSNPLQGRWHRALSGRPGYVIPCVADEKCFFFDAELREKVRHELGYDSDARVFVYSGSMGFYQGFDLVADWFAKAAVKLPSAQLLVITPAVDQARQMLGQINPAQVKIASAPFEHVNGYLNAADFAFLLRPTSQTNTAAFPTKFAEYGLAGLPVIAEPSVPDCYAMAKAAGNLIPASAAVSELTVMLSNRPEIMSHYVDRLTHGGLEAELRNLYSHVSLAD